MDVVVFSWGSYHGVSLFNFTLFWVKIKKKVPFFCVCLSCSEAVLAGGSFGECLAYSEGFGMC